MEFLSSNDVVPKNGFVSGLVRNPKVKPLWAVGFLSGRAEGGLAPRLQADVATNRSLVWVANEVGETTAPFQFGVGS
jgi:hypothetical protein